MHDGLATLSADDLGDDLVIAFAVTLVVAQGDRRAATVVEPLVSPGEHGREDREEVAPHVGEQVLIPRRVVLVEPLGHDPRVDQLAEPVGQRVPGDIQGSLELVEAGESMQSVADDEQRPGVTEHSDGARQRAWPLGEFAVHAVQFSY